MRYRSPANEKLELWRHDLKSYRQQSGLSVEAMAKHLGIPAFRLTKIEAGVQPATEELALRASEVWANYTDRDYDSFEEAAERDAEERAHNGLPDDTYEEPPRQSLADLFGNEFRP
jgi:transcriptional regulator with XRE-family HTH domain